MAPYLLDREEGRLLHVPLIQHSLLHKRGQDVRDSLIRERSEGLDFGLEFLNRLRHIHRGKVGDDFSGERLILYLRGGGLPRGCRLLFKEFDFVRRELDDGGHGNRGGPAFGKGDDFREHFLLSGVLGGSRSGGHGVSLSPFVRFGSSCLRVYYITLWKICQGVF